jgi:peptide/nickel transport system substrate-binding protein
LPKICSAPGLTLKPVVAQGTQWLEFPDQWNDKSAWHDERVRRAANLAMDRKGINQALTLGYSKLTNSIIPYTFEFYWQPPEPVYDPERAKQLLGEAGYPNGFDAGEYYCDAAYANVGEAILDNFQAVGMRCRLRPLERAAFYEGHASKKFHGIIQAGSGAVGNAATRLDAFVVKGGTYVSGSYPDIDALFQQQAAELDQQSARRPCTRCSSSSTSEPSLRRSGSWGLSMASGLGSDSRVSTRSRVSLTPRLTKTSR